MAARRPTAPRARDPERGRPVRLHVSRAFHYPAATRDYFPDDHGDYNEPSINKVAEAGIAATCSAGRFCPKAPITKEQFAGLLARALALPPATQDFFDDDTGTTFEADINRLAEAGIMAGCGVRTFCIKQAVTRGQVMALLHRALVPPTS